MSHLPCALPASAPSAGPASFAPYLPPVPRPPHDPYTLLLDGRLGWRASAGRPPVVPPATIGPAGACGALMLLPLPGSGRTLLEASGSFGGLVLPRHLVLADLGSCQTALLLFDAKGKRLRRFDPCRCEFVDFFCFEANDTRLPAGAAALAASCGRLYLADPTGRRVIVLNAATGAARGVWRAPLGTPTGSLPDWQPAALAIAPNGDVWVADRMHGALLRMTPSGRAVERHDGLGAVNALAADCTGRLLIAGDGAASVVRYDPARRTRLDPPYRPADVATAFPVLPLSVHADGSVDVSALCAPPCATPCVFDLAGERLAVPPADAAFAFPAAGTWLSQPIDSEIAECVWDRVVARATVPVHTTLALDTLTAETPLPDDEVLASGEWKPAFSLRAAPDGAQTWEAVDYMLLSPPGRYLWLRVRMTSNGAATPALDCLGIDFPRITWRRYLPAIFGAEAASAEFTDRWLALFDRSFRGIETEIDEQARLFDPQSAPAGGRHDFLGFLAAWIGLTGLGALPLARRREFLKYAPRAYAWRGTPRGLTHTLYLFFGLARWCGYEADPAACVPCPVAIDPKFRWRPPRLLLEHYMLRRWLWVGAGRLSDNAKLWGERIVNRSRLGATPPAGDRDETARLGVTQLKTTQDPARDPFHVYAHKLSVFVPAGCLEAPHVARTLTQLLRADVPAHVQTDLVPVEPRFRVGEAMLGLDAVIGYRAARPTLDTMALGQGTVLDGNHEDGGVHSLRVGTHRVGMNTTLQ